MPDVNDSPETTAVTFCATLLDEWVRAGVTDAVMAPGSRSTPMVLALAAEARIRLHVHHDERSAGFLALGLGLATGRPAVVLTTSGTAAVELHPAVVEAHEARVPLIVCTADRPPELHGVGAPQTIDQQHLYGRSVQSFADPGVPDEATDHTWRPLAAETYIRSVRGLGRPGGPVHLNLPFREPLVGEVGAPRPPGRPDGRPWEQAVVQGEALPDESLDALATGVAGRRGVIVAGAGIDDPGAVMALGRAVGWPVLADPRSGCRIPTESTISHADALLRVPSVVERLAPEVVVRLGALPASKVLGQWLSGLDAWQVGIEATGARFDPDRSLDALIAAEPGAAAAVLAGHLRGEPPRTLPTAPRAGRGHGRTPMRWRPRRSPRCSPPRPIRPSRPSPATSCAPSPTARPWWSRHRCRSATSSGSPCPARACGSWPTAAPTASTACCPRRWAWRWPRPPFRRSGTARPPPCSSVTWPSSTTSTGCSAPPAGGSTSPWS